VIGESESSTLFQRGKTTRPRGKPKREREAVKPDFPFCHNFIRVHVKGPWPHVVKHGGILRRSGALRKCKILTPMIREQEAKGSRNHIAHFRKMVG
jgi:hypothetical protein